MTDWNKYSVKGFPGLDPNNVPVRQNLADYTDEQLALYLEGLMRFQNAPATDPVSWQAIAGIHGAPYTTWPAGNTEIKQLTTNMGFCTHSSILFLTWHRPFLSLFETSLYTHVNAAADSIDSSFSDKAKYQKLAKDFRIPYWDWAARTNSHWPKAVLSDGPYQTNTSLYKNSSFKAPPFKRDSKWKTDYNPLFTYPFQQGTSSSVSRNRSTTVRNPFSGATGAESKLNAFFNDASSGNDLSNLGSLNHGIVERNLSERVAYTVKAYERFGPMCFNSYSDDSGVAVANAEIWGSFEDIHNTMHGLVGGHMGSVATSAFDPIFWLHHCNIDRVFSLWQAMHESAKADTFVTDITGASSWDNFARKGGSAEGPESPLYPFRNLTKNRWWTSTDAKRTEAFGYAYPEIRGFQYTSPTAIARMNLNKAINDAYSPASNFVAQSKARIATAGASLLPQSAVLKKIDSENLKATAVTQQQVSSQLPAQQVLLKTSNEPEKPFLRDLAPKNKYLEWLVNLKVEKHAMDGELQVFIFLGPVEEQDSALWPLAPTYVGSFIPLGSKTSTGCDKCQEDQEHSLQVTGQIPLTLALMERYLAEILPDISEDSVIPYLKTNLHWRVKTRSGTAVPDRGAIPGLKIFVVSNECTVPDDPNAPPTYAPDVKIYPEITTSLDGSGRGEGSGLTAAEVPA